MTKKYQIVELVLLLVNIMIPILNAQPVFTLLKDILKSTHSGLPTQYFCLFLFLIINPWQR